MAEHLPVTSHLATPRCSHAPWHAFKLSRQLNFITVHNQTGTSPYSIEQYFMSQSIHVATAASRQKRFMAWASPTRTPRSKQHQEPKKYEHEPRPTPCLPRSNTTIIVITLGNLEPQVRPLTTTPGFPYPPHTLIETLHARGPGPRFANNKYASNSPNPNDAIVPRGRNSLTTKERTVRRLGERRC